MLEDRIIVQDRGIDAGLAALMQNANTGTSATLPILIGTNGDTRPLVTYNNEPVRVENLAGTGIYLLHYNKYTNQVFLVSDGYKATATPSA